MASNGRAGSIPASSTNKINDDMLDLELHIILHGCSKATIYRHKGQSIAVFKSIKVDSCKRRKGYGNELLNTLENIARNLGCDSCTLWVNKYTWMHDWYKRKGYEDFDDYDEQFIWMYKQL